MTMEVFFAIYVLLEDAPDNGLKKGHEIVGSKGYFSRETCAEEARLIAQKMYADNGSKYGFKCKPVDFDPPNLDAAAQRD